MAQKTATETRPQQIKCVLHPFHRADLDPDWRPPPGLDSRLRRYECKSTTHFREPHWVYNLTHQRKVTGT